METNRLFFPVVILVIAVHLILIFSFRVKGILPEVQESPAILGALISQPDKIEVAQPENVPPQKPKEPLRQDVVETVLSTRALSESKEKEVTPEFLPAVEKTTVAEVNSASNSVNQLVLPQSDAEQFNNPAPIYPPMSRRAKEEGRVVLELTVLANGTVANIRVKISSGYSRLDQSALQAVRSWKFIPARRGNTPIDYEYELPIDFSLRKNGQ